MPRIRRFPFKGEITLAALAALLLLDYLSIWTPGWGTLLNVLLYGVLFTAGTGLVCLERGTGEAENFLGSMLLIELKGSIILGLAALLGGVAYPLFLFVRKLLG
ncbi:MAG: hypothetical protein U0411_13545 [Thermodesulfovibrionales bacterium]